MARVDELNWLVSTASERSYLPAGFHEAKKIDMIEKPHVRFSGKDPNKSMDATLSDHTMHIDSDISDELRNKVTFNFLLKINFFLFEMLV